MQLHALRDSSQGSAVMISEDDPETRETKQAAVNVLQDSGYLHLQALANDEVSILYY